MVILLNFLKRAWFAVARKPGRTFILLIIFFAVANLVLAGISIQHATEQASTMARQKLGGTLTLSFDIQKAMASAQSAASSSTTQQGGRFNFNITQTPLTEDIVKTVAKQKNIIDYNIIVSTSGMAKNFTAVKTATTSSESSSQQQQRQFPGGNANFVTPDVTIVGLRSTELYDDFSSGSAVLQTGGAQITQDENGKAVAIIEQTLATANNLKIGDSIQVAATASTTARSLTIIGIFKSSSESTTNTSNFGNIDSSFSQPYNKIYIDYSTALTLKADAAAAAATTTTTQSFGGGQAPAISSAIYYLDDPKNIDAAKADIAKMSVDWNKFSMTSEETAYDAMVGSIQKVASFASIVVIVVAIIGAALLALILLLNVKDRMFETGVLLSMGESRLKLVMQFTAEMLMIAVVAFSISFFSGGFIGQKIGNYLVANQVTTDSQVSSQPQGGMPGFSRAGGGTQFSRLTAMRGRGGVNSTYKPISAISVKVTFTEILQVIFAGFLIILLATVVPIISIMRYKPRSILTRAG
jgi:putative ABC transport system permease protein